MGHTPQSTPQQGLGETAESTISVELGPGEQKKLPQCAHWFTHREA
jgi:hypothetical protein